LDVLETGIDIECTVTGSGILLEAVGLVGETGAVDEQG
jgi:hypothetical protein